MSKSDLSSARDQINELFGSLKAEWLKEKMYELLTIPKYFPELITSSPCMLVGGRGTGKTTILRALSFEGQAIRNKTPPQDWTYYGLYHRVNTNRVRAFQGSELREQDWIRLFAHYMNLVMVSQVVEFLVWYYATAVDAEPIDLEVLNNTAISLHLPLVDGLDDLSRELKSSHLRFEAHINNVATSLPSNLSMQGSPVDALLEGIQQSQEFGGKNFFFLIDEYENYSDYQQRVVNTLIKHSGDLYTFKIGVRELGLRQRETLNRGEQLVDPADYHRISIVEKLSEEGFSEFAQKVCDDRIRRVRLPDGSALPSVRELLRSLSIEEEASLLGLKDVAGGIRKEHREVIEAVMQDTTLDLNDTWISFIDMWARGQQTSFEFELNHFLADRDKWEQRFNNYGFAWLFTLRKNKTGIRKYYAGWDVFTVLSASNIRYLLELVVEALTLQLNSESLGERPISAKIQTEAAQAIGRKNLSELEGMSVYGAKLTKLLLGLGRIFQVLAETPEGHTPEVNEFYIAEYESLGADGRQRVEDILKNAIMHLALVRSPGNKLLAETDTKEFNYQIHPIFSAFFQFSHRRKRKMKLNAEHLLRLIEEPRTTIREILREHYRGEETEKDLPDQMKLFEGYYSA